MNEAQWNTAPIADLLLQTIEIHRIRHGAESEGSFVLREPHSAMRVDLGRKHMLLAYGILRQYWDSLAPELQNALAVLEAFEEVPDQPPTSPLDDYGYVADLFLAPLHHSEPHSEASMAMYLVAGWWPEAKQVFEGRQLPEGWRSLIHDVFGDHFTPSSGLDTAWLHWNDGTIQKLAESIYETRAFTEMSRLADTLQSAGCTDSVLLNHCRASEQHIRGCWVLDLLLGRD